MARFPKRESEVVVLAQVLITGLTDNLAVYPTPPVLPLDMTLLLAGYNIAKNAAIAAEAAYAEAVTDKDDALADLVDGMKTDLSYAENTVGGDDDKLKLLGWGGRKTPSAMTAPGQSRLLEAPKQGAGWVFLDWKKPSDGGLVSAYKIMRRERPEGAWAEVATAVISEATLVEQPTAKELEYRIIAINKAGDGEPSNTAMVVL